MGTAIPEVMAIEYVRMHTSISHSSQAGLLDTKLPLPEVPLSLLAIILCVSQLQLTEWFLLLLLFFGSH